MTQMDGITEKFKITGRLLFSLQTIRSMRLTSCTAMQPINIWQRTEGYNSRKRLCRVAFFRLPRRSALRRYSLCAIASRASEHFHEAGCMADDPDQCHDLQLSC